MTVRLSRDFSPLEAPFDVVVIGGGISGVQIARHSAGRGLRTLLLERDDFGSGTSSATTKAIHGGLRYLEQYDFGVVQESVTERRNLGIAAPHLVAPRHFLLTAWNWSKPPAPVLGAGVALYEAMAWKRNIGVPKDVRAQRFRWVGREALLRRVPWLDPEGLQGAWAHDDSLSLHPERLLLALVHSAIDLGAVAFNHAEVAGLVAEPKGSGTRITGARVIDRISGREHIARGRVVVNAAGPWVDSALGDLADRSGISVQRAKGVHLLMGALGQTDSLYARGKNGSHFVVNPWQSKTLVGPTDTAMDGDADSAAATVDDIDYLLETINSVAARPFTVDDVESTLVGVRPLVDDGKPTKKASRRFDIHDHSEHGLAGLYSVTGGKWTTGRAMAEKVVDHVIGAEPVLPPTRGFDSRTLPVAGAFGDYVSVEAAFEAALLRRSDAGLPRDVRLHLARMYGTEHERILDLVAADPALGARLSQAPDRLDIAAQVVYAVTDEGACTLRDIVDRRLALGSFGRVEEGALRAAAEIAAGLLGWSDDEAEQQVSEYLLAQQRVQDVIAAARDLVR
ncbi:MAG: glycerol-3-phosphate dehydrogenase/oxidase [Leucobacter sp.]